VAGRVGDIEQAINDILTFIDQGFGLALYSGEKE
jgi:hypothetical protein